MSKWLQHTVLEQPAEKASTISPHYHVPWQNIPSDSAKCMVIVACQTACNVRKRQLKCTYLWYGALKMTFKCVTVNVLRRDQKRSTETALRVQRRNLVSNSNTTPMVRWSFMHSSVDCTCVGLRRTLAGGWLVLQEWPGWCLEAMLIVILWIKWYTGNGPSYRKTSDIMIVPVKEQLIRHKLYFIVTECDYAVVNRCSKP